MNEDEDTSSTIRDANSEGAETPNSVAGIKLEKILSSSRPLPPKSLKRYTTRQLRKRHTEPWLVFLILAIAATILAANFQKASDSSDQNSCIISDGSEAEQLFRINFVAARGLSFAKAKFIDLLWDTAIGQGGRFIHGLILHQLISRAVTLLLERSALSYVSFLGIKFSTVSIESLWRFLCIMFPTTPLNTTVISGSSFLVIGYVLAFPTIWSATTGYEADTIPAYDILGTGAFITKDSDRLTTCWSVQDPGRFDSNLIHPIIGPTFAQSYETWENIGDMKEFDRLNMRTEHPTVETSAEFRNLYAYAIAKETFLYRYNGSIDSTMSQQIYGMDNWYENDCYNNSVETASGYNFSSSCVESQLYTSVVGWQYAGVGQKDAEKLPSDTRHIMLEPGSHANLSDSDFIPYDTTFHLDSNISFADGVIPYTSVLWWNNTRIALDAPFISMETACKWSKGNLGLCLCFDGKVLSQDFRKLDQICLNDTGYRWGFSGFVLVVALALESAWLLICATMWSVIITKSEFVKMHRPGTGVIRGVLDIAGAIESRIGSDTGAYTEEELERELAKCPPVGYDIDHEPGYQRILLRPMRHGIRTRRSLHINGRTSYG
ncbi:hypothetical protein F5B18DRAFT_650864 [Nemania serpens]|nr:hypothetical protein F5B18DRAFT_650864 [Nemania serpens]